MIQTNTGYKIVMSKGPIADTVDGVKSINNFFSVMEDEGFWYALTGKHFGEWFIDICQAILQFVVDISDVLIIVGMILLLLIMFGSKKSPRWLYWTVSAYILIQTLGLAL